MSLTAEGFNLVRLGEADLSTRFVSFLSLSDSLGTPRNPER